MFRNKKTTLLLLAVALALMVEIANADFTFGEPTNLGPAINSADLEVVPSISPDGLELYFIRTGEAWVARRETPNAEWEPASNLGSTINSLSDAGIPCISADGLSLYFTSSRPGGYGESDIWVTRRATHNDPWGDPENLGPAINSASADWHSSISTDGLELYFSSNRPGGYGGDDLWVTRRATTDTPWTEPENLGSTLNSSKHDACPSLSADGLLLFFTSWQSDGYGSNFGLCDVFVARRATTEDPWGPPVNLGPVVNSPYVEWGVSVSADGSTLYFHSDRPGGSGNYDIWQAPIKPVVDFNGDGIVDSADMCIIVDHWGENYSYCDIGPTPLGDGVVDTQDLIVLSEYFFEDINDSTLVAHWALDETEGMVVADSAGDNNGYALGEPIWQPDAGMVDGALQLDGVDDYVITGAALNPANGPFSVLAWVNGGAPGQVIASQQGTANWLMADTGGNLMTELKSSTQDATDLLSQAIITDGYWHRVGFVWDGANRILYVDDVAVAQDTQDSLRSSVSGLYIGCGKAMEAGTYWSGLIDDVRIYNRAVRP